MVCKWSNMVSNNNKISGTLASNRLYYYYVAAAASTALAGILHLAMASNIMGRSITTGSFFIVAGLAQIFWILPMVKQWGRPWYYTGIAGTIVLIILYLITRVPNFITNGRALAINEIGIATVALQILYVAITVIILAKERNTEAVRNDQ
jgi:hypothetical protein